ncbi:ATP-binding protein [Novosphingopyxis sp. YJ-S2-01]|uniref:ATP-binding protein n=1 Tax=Novosphingopyxis sp. YJ-S2-01 TaxID=2794021 RepID=UPI001E515CD2|nr:ATP-binding protein [Novosphingopyxis sp. YJ-S2-01]
MALLFFWLSHEYRRSEHLRSEERTSYDRRMEVVSLLGHLAHAETAQRGYLLTGKQDYLRPYYPARAQARRSMASLANSSRERGRDAENIELQTLAAAKFMEMERVIALREQGRAAEAYAVVEQGQGKRVMDRLRRIADRMLVRESRTLDGRRTAFYEQRTRMRTLIVTAMSVLILSLFVGLTLLWRTRCDRFEARAAADGADERNRAILDSTVDGLLILNASGTIESANPAARALLKLSDETLVRRDICTFVDIAPGQGSFSDRIGLVDGALTRTFFPDRLATTDGGETVPVDITVGLMSIPGGPNFVMALHDITERKRAERSKDDLISTVSHELRTPLTSIIGALGLIRAREGSDLPERDRRLIDIAESNSRRLIRLINDILDVDRIESGRLALEIAPADLAELAQEAGVQAQGIADAASVSVEWKHSGPVPVECDTGRVLQVAGNLLSNAIRVTPAGSTVGISASIIDGRAVMRIDDEGPGVPAEFRHRIFGRFERAHLNENGGTGLGLAISREIVERHGGRIWFEDRPDGGSRFAFTLPLRLPDRPSPRILVAAADDRLAGGLAMQLNDAGFAHDRVLSAQEALSAIEQLSYEAILVGVGVPESGGLAFVRKLTDSLGSERPPVLVVAMDGEQGIATGADVIDYVLRPAEADRLRSALRRAIDGNRKARPVVLHLDDDYDLLTLAAEALGNDLELVRVSTLPAAREAIIARRPDVAVLDLNLAGESGLDLLPFMIDQDGIAIPTIIYSAHDVSPEQARRVDAVLIKTRNALPDLGSTIRRVLERREAAL